MNKESKIKPIFKTTGKIILVILIISSFILLIRGSESWCRYTEVFNISTIYIYGNRILSNDDIIRMASIQQDTSLNTLNLTAIQTELESNPFIKAASVSREYPNTVNIMICERIPLCYINHNSLFLVDAEGIVLPVPDKPLEMNLPIITGFDNDSLDYLPGYYVPNSAVLEIIQVVNSTLISAPNLFSEISEIHCWKNHNYILYTIKSGTPIYLGDKSLTEQLTILANFQNRIDGKRNLSDYQYLDLRWNKQIVAKERHS